jgi:ParB-like chromosome segregation protein Spo0J
VQRTHYEPVADSLKEKVGLDLAARSKTLRDVVWSTAVQHGPPGDADHGHAVRLITAALSGWNKTTIARATDEQLIRAIYAERWQKRADGKYVYFPKLKSMRRSIDEPREALRRLALEPPKQTKTQSGNANMLPDVRPLPDVKKLPDTKPL